MAFNVAPTGYFANINVTGVIGGVTGVFIPYSDLESFDYTVATSGSGDIRELVYSINEAVADEWLSLSTANRSSQMTISRTSSVPEDNILRKVYTITLNLDFGNLDVTDE